MDVDQALRYIDSQEKAIQSLTSQLDEIQVAFNAQFDQFKAQHDAKLDHLTDQVAEQIAAVGTALRKHIEERLPEDQQAIDERRRKLREEYLPQRQQAADDLLRKAQAELAKLRALNPQLDEREEELKSQKVELEARLAALNQEVRQKSRGLGIVLHLLSITKTDRERHRVLGKLETINDSLYHIRRQWEQEREKMAEQQQAYQKQWQLESIAVARLQAELDQLDDETRREDLALRRAIRHSLDNLKESVPGSVPAMETALQEMVELNIQTDAYHEGLASVGGLIGLLRGISNGMDAIRKSLDGLKREQQMHHAYLRALEFQLPARVEDFHKQWLLLDEQFTDEKAIGEHPEDFAATVQPLLEGSLSQANIEAMFNSLGTMISQAAESWG
jgi:DNA repair exonuclease SbcCD ATPase subunit